MSFTVACSVSKKGSAFFILCLLLIGSCQKEQLTGDEQGKEIFPGIQQTASVLPGGFEESLIVSGLQDPSGMDFSPEGNLLIGERIQGKLQVLLPDGTLLAEPMISLDIPKNEDGIPTRHNSSGIRGFVYDPDYPEEPYIYIFYMQHEPRHNRVSRFRIDEENPNQVVEGSEEVLIELPFNEFGSSGSHNGGALIFGRDGKLYITTGDGWQSHGKWGGGEPVQSLRTLTGKVLRVNRDGTIPADNPFYEQTTGDYRAIYALGLRNPFSMSRHPSSNQIYINDANMSDGRPQKDHILKLVKGANYKWERPEHQQQWNTDSPGIPVEPYAVAGAQVITGGAWYPETGPFPEQYHGSYFIALWGGNDPRPGALVRMISKENTTIEPFLPSAGDGMHGMGKPVYTRIGPDGSLYWLATSYETNNGSVFKISYTGEIFEERLTAPKISPYGGKYPYPVMVQLETDTPQERIYYTLDGSVPNVNSSRYEEPISIAEPQELRARSFKDGFAPSEIATALFNIYEDQQPPEMVLVLAETSTRVHILFDEAVEQSTAGDINNYELSPAVEIHQAKLNFDFKSVTLTTSRLSDDITHKLTVSNIFDRARPSNQIREEIQLEVLWVNEDFMHGITSRDEVKPFLNMPETNRGKIPALLSETGAFEDVHTLTPIEGILPYSVNSPQWNNGASMYRWVAVPYSEENSTEIGFSTASPWSFPPGTVFIRHVETVINEKTNERRRLETQFLVADASGGFYPVTYKWREDGREADLVSPQPSQAETIAIRTGKNDTLIEKWRIDSRSCMACHTGQSGYILGVNTRQLNRNYFYKQEGVTNNQLRRWNSAGLFGHTLTGHDISLLPKMAALNEKNVSLDHRLNAYLDANCGNCHRPDGVMGPSLDLRYETGLKEGLVQVEANNIFGIEGSKAIVPGDPQRSIVVQRMTTDIPALLMPQFSNRIDNAFVDSLKRWVENLELGDYQE